MTPTPFDSKAAERAKAMGNYPRTAIGAVAVAPKSAVQPLLLHSNVLSIIRRIETYLDEETLALKTTVTFDLAASNNRKSQGLLELNRAMRAMGSADSDPALRMQLASLRGKLETNMHVIRMHLNAVREISELLSEAIQSADSDGTYSPAIRAYRSEA